MKHKTIFLVLIILLATACAAAQNNIDMFIMDYPHGEYRIHVNRKGEAYLFYGEKPSAQIIRKYTFSVESLYGIFRPHLQPNLPREQWPNPASQAGMVTIRYADGREEDFLIFDVPEITKMIFDKAKQNIVGEF